MRIKTKRLPLFACRLPGDSIRKRDDITDPSNTDSAKGAKCTQEPSATSAGQDRISIGWTDTSNDEEGFTIERQEDGSSQWQQAGTAETNSSSFLDTGLSAGTLYRYRVNAFNSAGASAYTSTVSAETEAAAGSGTGSTTQIDISVSGYKVKGVHHGQFPGQAPAAQRSIFIAMGRKSPQPTTTVVTPTISA